MAGVSEDLLDQAERLATQEKNKPKQASVRRAISNAYYALFHFFGEKVTMSLAGTKNNNANVRAWLARALEHKSMDSVCKFFGNPNDRSFQAFSAQLNFAPSFDLKTIADAFVSLQESRHRADYDFSKPITRDNALIAIAEARMAMATWRLLEKEDPRMILIFCLALLRGTKRS